LPITATVQSGPPPGQVGQQAQVDPVVDQAEEPDHRPLAVAQVVGQRRLPRPGPGEVLVVDPVERQVSLGVVVALVVPQGARRGEDHVGLPAQVALHAGDALAVDVEKRDHSSVQ
jgi:hypothetical protein